MHGITFRPKLVSKQISRDYGNNDMSTIAQSNEAILANRVFHKRSQSVGVFNKLF
jgi:hypothetical protein